MTYPCGLLFNEKLTRWHPIPFRCAPLPSDTGLEVVHRHKSIGHHTEGFATKEEAIASIAAQGWTLYDIVWNWDGEESPHMQFWF